MWPGNTADVTVLVPVVERMKRRFCVRQICVLADRGMIRKKTIDELEAADPPVRYILGARMRRQKEVSETVLKRRGAWEEVYPERIKSKDPAPLKVREVMIKGRRYKGYRRYLKVEGQSHFAVDETRVRDEERFDGIWVLRTNTDYPTTTVALQYKRLWMVEAMIRSTKSIMETRPIYHKCDETIRGHVFCSFLALRLKAELEKRLRDRGEQWEWAEVLRGLDNLQEVEASFRGRRYLLRSKLVAHAHKAIRAAGVAAPRTIREAWEPLKADVRVCWHSLPPLS
jgi:transposase